MTSWWPTIIGMSFGVLVMLAATSPMWPCMQRRALRKARRDLDEDLKLRRGCGETFCVCGGCFPGGAVVYASPEFLAKHPETVVEPPRIREI